MNMPQPAARPCTALLLTGGGARAAYQVGVLQAIAALRRRSHPGQHGLPFDIVVGTSAGAINAMALACAADRFHHGVAQLARVWGHMGSHQVYRVDARDALRGGLHWLGLFLAGWWSGRQGRTLQPRSLLDNARCASCCTSSCRCSACPACWRAATCAPWRSPARATAATSTSPSTMPPRPSGTGAACAGARCAPPSRWTT
ncbi:patatin-like phospholipase family protein [Ottowia pentelensis]|uniref:patatin-like phospholipase family protein n=1 Tax=Ottowia pentelensis TaxID=511108 RepID=UPI00363D25C4